MSFWRLIINNLSYYRWKNLTVVLGISIAVGVLTGALIVGDSVSYNLNRLVELRLGNIHYAMTTGERFVTPTLAEKLTNELQLPVSPVLVSEGVATSRGGEFRVNNVQVLGVNEKFDQVGGTGTFYSEILPGEIILSSNLASRLEVFPDDEILLRIRKASLIPLNAPFVSDEDVIVSARFRVKAIADDENLGRFNLRVSQTSPYNAFINIETLNRLMELENKANLLLFSGNNPENAHDLRQKISRYWTPGDAGLQIRKLEETSEMEIISDRVFLDSPAINAIRSFPVAGEFILTYFVNSISPVRSNFSAAGEFPSTPYSFISTLPDSVLSGNDIMVNTWLADDLGIKEGDSLEVKYFTVGPLRRLVESSELFVVREVVAMEGRFSDMNLMPDIPGLSDAGNCRDWDTGIPIELGKIRDKDEDYWEKYKGTPKAFISLSLAKELWENLYGSFTSVRFPASSTGKEILSAHISAELDPVSLGYMVSAVRDESLTAAGQGIDFSQLFLALSFFVLLSSLILTVILLVLNLEGRREQLRTISALGIAHKTIRGVMFTEGFFLSFAGSLAGILLAVLYTDLVFKALNSVWIDIVRTDMMLMVVNPLVLITGFLAGVLISWLTLVITIRNFLRHPKVLKAKRFHRKWNRLRLYAAWASGLISIILIISQIVNSEIVNTGIFFPAGGLMLISCLLFFYHLLSKGEKMVFRLMDTKTLSVRSSLRNKNRSLGIVSLLGMGTFIVLSTGANRKDFFADALDQKSGTGGFLYYAEATVPLTRDFNDPAVRQEYGLRQQSSFVQFSRVPGDDASCFNLNRVSNPAILGVNPGQLKDRFSFVARTPFLSADQPWESLQNPLPGGLIPAIADQTVIKWGLGMKVGDTLVYTDNKGRDVRLLLIGGLANSIFQGNLIIADEYFQKHWPDYIGSSVVLTDADIEIQQEIEQELNLVFRDYGWDMQLAAERLAAFNSVENTYLSIFLLMGALAILIGTVGISFLLARSILERKTEIALFTALGISRKKIYGLFIKEYFSLLLLGILAGAITSTLATLPSLLSPHTGISFYTIFLIILVLLVNGAFWIWLMARVFIRDRGIVSSLREE